MLFSACYVVSVLVVSLSLGTSAPTPTPTPQDCEAAVTPVALDAAKMTGRWYFMEGFADNELFVSILKTMDSAWIHIATSSPDDTNSTLTMMEYNRINGTCYRERFQIALVSETTMDFIHNTDKDPNIHVGDINKGSLLPSCVNCLVFNFITSISGVSTPIHTEHLTLLVREQSVTEADLRAFRHQAQCLNFSLPAPFLYKQDREFCAEDNVTVAVQ